MASCAGDTTLEVVTTEAEFDSAIRSHELVIVDFMARWCRKCIYLKPKLERMLREDFPDVRILFVDVNAVPSAVIKKSGVKKMPTIQLYKNGEQGPEHIAAEGAIDALEKIKLMVLRNTDLKLPQTT
jgi:thiol-disulfide isomerase/thioredoxin